MKKTFKFTKYFFNIEYNIFKYYKMKQINYKNNFSYNSKKNKINSNKIIDLRISNRNHFQMACFIFFSLINFILAEKIFSYRNLNNDNIINLVINGGGYHKVVGSKILPDEVYINGKLADISNNGYITIKEFIKKNKITLIWKKKLVSCESLFESCFNINEIDLSKFDTSEVTSMARMFFECINLQRINFDNINTSSVTSMSRMFEYCESLKKLNLSMFKTPKLKSMEFMFYETNFISDLDITSFDTSQVTSMEYMFFGMLSLLQLLIKF
jgi:surface protein